VSELVLEPVVLVLDRLLETLVSELVEGHSFSFHFLDLASC